MFESRGLDFLGGTKHFWRTPQLLVPPFCISILKLSRNQILCHSLDFYVFCMIQRIFFVRVFKILQIKEGGPNFWGEPSLQKVWIIWSPLLYFKFKTFLDTNSWSFIRFQSLLHDWWVLFSECFNFYKLQTGNLNCVGNQFCKMSELFGPPSVYISILKFWYTQFLSLSLDFNAFCMIQEYFSHTLETSTN